jgi:catechol 2,3-dioxygenase-like lactoylglutathione lyase family enzyme
MIDHTGYHVSDIETSKTFYDKALAPLGYVMLSEFPEWKMAGYGAGNRSDFWIVGDGVKQIEHVAFVALNKEAVEKFYAEGLASGGTDNGAPGYRTEYSPGYYAAFIKDPDGHNVEVVFHDPTPS